MLAGTDHVNVVPSYVDQFWDSSIKHGFTEAATNLVKTEGFELRVFHLIEEQSAFVQNISCHFEEAKVQARSAKDDCSYEGRVPADEVPTF